MAWFSKSKSKDKGAGKKEELWIICSRCKAHVYKDEWQKNTKVCPKCNYHGRLTYQERLDILVDPGTFQELDENITPSDPLRFVDGKGSYKDKIKDTVSKANLKESVVTGYAKIDGRPVVLAIMDFRFFGGSLGSGTGEKILRASNLAYEKRLPYIIFSASGGARMQEGMLSLMQMAKTCAGIARLKEKGIPYISVLTDPTSGGVSASYAMMGDINIAEPKALIAFAGRRVIEGTIKQKLPKDFQSAEYLLEHGFIDAIVDRKTMKETLGKILAYRTLPKKRASSDSE